MSQLVRTAWKQDPRLAVRLTSRFSSERLYGEVRNLLRAHPERLVDEPDALHILIGASLPPDLSSQLRVSGNKSDLLAANMWTSISYTGLQSIP